MEVIRLDMTCIVCSKVSLTSILLRFREAAVSSCVVDFNSLLRLVGHVDGTPEGMIDLRSAAIGEALDTRDQILAHVFVWEHGQVFNAEGLEDVSLKVVVELKAGDALYTNASPVYSNLSHNVISLGIDEV